jgi:hypothetical protein
MLQKPDGNFLIDLFRPQKAVGKLKNETLIYFSCDGQLNPSSATEEVDTFYLLYPTSYSPTTETGTMGMLMQVSTNNCDMKETNGTKRFSLLSFEYYFLCFQKNGRIFRECCSKLCRNIIYFFFGKFKVGS